MVEAIWNAYLKLEDDNNEGLNLRKIYGRLSMFSDLLDDARNRGHEAYAVNLGEDIELRIKANVVHMHAFLTSRGSNAFPERNPYIINCDVEQEMEALATLGEEFLSNTDFYIANGHMIMSGRNAASNAGE